jgi:LAO/AO transport system kinase
MSHDAREVGAAPDREVGAYADRIRAGDRKTVARTITLLESKRRDRAERGQAILEKVLPETGRAVRLGITGTPGVGKSTFIETLGLRLIEAGKRVAVLAVDPSSQVSGGSILGDKTRMERLAQREEAYIRPSPSSGELGGVAQRTREALLVCEAAGYDVVIVETVGVGQSEATVASMVDFFAVLLQPGAGDELQGLKKGVLEIADALVVNKADGPQKLLADRTCAEHASAVQLFRTQGAWRPRVLKTSAQSGEGIDAFWETVLEHRSAVEETGELERRRREQDLAWMWSLVKEGLDRGFREHPEVAARIASLEAEVAAREVAPAAAARLLLELFRKG